jgi:hypothetical protein
MWHLLVIVALLWPSHISAKFDGIPLDDPLEAALFGLAVPCLIWLHPRFLRTTAARVSIVALLLLKIGASLALVQEGFCVTFDPPKPMVWDSKGKPHSWDMRADWRSLDPVCSAVMTRSYYDSFTFPAWFFNLPPPDDATNSDGYHPGQILIRVGLHGVIDAPPAGTLRFRTDPAMNATLLVDDRPVISSEPGSHEAAVPAGAHWVQVDATLAGKQWSLVPSWNGADLGSPWFPPTTLQPPSRLDRFVRPAANWIIDALALLLIVGWSIDGARHLGHAGLLLTSAAAAACVAVVAAGLRTDAAFYTAQVLALALVIPVRPRFVNMRGAFLLIAVPWLAFVAAANAHQVAHWIGYGVGNDNFKFQRYAYRVFMQGFWLEGGQLAFWNQPLYRWIAGSLHMIFGDSSVGEAYWDAGGISIIALFAYHAVKPSAGFRWGMVAAIVVFAMFLLGPTLEFVGFGLSEISSAALIYLAAFFAMRGRRRDAVVAGVLVTLGFYTRLNNLPMALAVAAFALPLDLPVRAALWPSQWWSHIRWRIAVGIVVSLSIGLLLFAWRTWYYNGVFSVFYGTQRDFLAVWKPDMPLLDGLAAMLSSLLMVLTASDPPQLAWHALPLLIGAVVASGALLGAPVLRDAPLPCTLFFLAGCSGALVTRGWGHEGRFSIHLFGAASALAVWATHRATIGVGKRIARKHETTGPHARRLLTDRRRRPEHLAIS